MRAKNVNRLQSVNVETGMVLTATYTSGNSIRVDLSDVAHRLEAFAPLESRREFRRAALADFGWGVEWPCGASLDSDRLLEMALEQQGQVANVDFRRWQDRHQLSLTDAAKAIGLTRRTVSQYRTGARPVPRTVTLACKGWEMEQSRPKRGRARIARDTTSSSARG
ncbi:MAG: hypothetical protein WC540_13815 [Sulfuritalea sp.]